MSAAVTAAIVTSTVTPILAGFFAWLGGRVNAKAVREGQRWETVRACSDKVHDKTDVDVAQLAYNQLAGLVDGKTLTEEQRTWAKTAVRSYLDRRLAG
jgi:hypothetical protein